MCSARIRYGVCEAQIDESGQVEKGKCLPIRGEGTVCENTISEKILPVVEEKGFKFPIMIYSYWSKYPASRTDLNIIVDGRGIRFRPRKSPGSSKSYDWLVDETRRIHRLRNFNIV